MAPAKQVLTRLFGQFGFSISKSIYLFTLEVHPIQRVTGLKPRYSKCLPYPGESSPNKHPRSRIPGETSFASSLTTLQQQKCDQTSLAVPSNQPADPFGRVSNQGLRLWCCGQHSKSCVLKQDFSVTSDRTDRTSRAGKGLRLLRS